MLFFATFDKNELDFGQPDSNLIKEMERIKNKYNISFTDFETDFLLNDTFKSDFKNSLQPEKLESNIISNEESYYLWEFFKLFDKGNKNHMDYNDLKTAFEIMFENFQEFEKEYKITKDIKIDFELFKKFFIN